MILVDDLRFALRSIGRRPLFAVVVVMTLGLAIGVNSGMFSLINAALLSSQRVRAPEQLVNIYTTDTLGQRHGNSSYPDYVHLRDNSRSLSGVFGYSGLITALTGQGQPEVVFGELVTGNYFAISGARLALGRGFVADEDRTPNTHPVVVISHRLWERRFGGDSAIIGKPITMNGHAFVVIGVAHREFNGLLFRGLSADLWAPVMMMGQLRTDQRDNRAERWMFVKGRLADGRSEANANVELATLGSQLSAAYPLTNRGRRFVGIPASNVLLAPDGDRVVAPTAVLMLVIVGFVVLIASTNLANLMLARGASRRREIAIRFALGAGRGRVVTQLVTESALLALMGGALGLAIAQLLARMFVAFRPPLPVPIALDISIDWRVALYTLLAMIVACALFGLIPALKASRGSVASGLSSHDAAPRRQGLISRSRNAFLVPQIALSMVLLFMAGLFARSVGNAGAVDPGFDIMHTAMIALDLRQSGYDETRARAFYAELTRRLQEQRVVQAVAVTDRIPLDLYGNQSTTIEVVGADTAVASAATQVQMAHVAPGYFEALGIPLIRGRAFREGNDVEANGVIVSEYTARTLWPRTDALGQQLRLDESDAMHEVIGVVANTRIQTLGEPPQLFVYRPFSTRYASLIRTVARGSGNASALVATMRREVNAIDPTVPVFESKTMTEHLDVMLFPFRIAAQVSAALGAFGLLLATVGLYGVVAFGVARRTREYGIRVALGARPIDVQRMVMQGSVSVVAIGLIIGLAMALAIGRLISGLLFGIGAGDPVTLVTTTLVLVSVAAMASYVPARRATKVDPVVALREE